MKEIKKSRIAFEVLLVVLFFALFAWLIHTLSKSGSTVEPGGYRIVEQEIKLPEAPSKLVVSEAGIALFYEKASYAAVYSSEGAFQYGISVDSSDRGTGNMSFLDGNWVIFTRNNTLYFFRGKELTASYSVTINENLELYREIKLQMGNYDSLTCSYEGETYSYSRRDQSVIKSDGKTETVVLRVGSK